MLYLLASLYWWCNDKSVGGKSAKKNKHSSTKTLHRILNIEQYEPYSHLGCTEMLRNGKQFLLHMGYL